MQLPPRRQSLRPLGYHLLKAFGKFEGLGQIRFRQQHRKFVAAITAGVIGFSYLRPDDLATWLQNLVTG